MSRNKAELIVNVGNIPINSGKYDQDALEAIKDFTNMTTEEAANISTKNLHAF